MTVIIGSVAIEHHFPGQLREPKDLDVLTPYEGVSYSFDGLVEPFWHPDLALYFPMTREIRFATIDELYTLKKSHSYWELNNGSWDKHMFDLEFLRARGATPDPLLHDLLYSVWEKVHGKKKVNLTYDSDRFFKDAVIRKYDHDSLHESVAYGDRAMYTLILKEGSTVEVDSKKMWSLGFDNLILLFREEILATALERIVIPSNYLCSPGAAYQWALRRTITSLTKGKSAEFIVDNFDLLRIPDPDYVTRHLDNRSKLILLEES